jgi:hypothetical protein
MSHTTTVDVELVVDALQSMVLASGLTACALIMGFDEATEQVVAHVALVLAFDAWSEDALSACENARSVAWASLSPLDVVPNLLCRLAKEHQALSQTEPEWRKISGSC